VVEDAPVDVLFRRPLHPYTEGLMASVPAIEGETARLYSIPGRIPDPDEVVAGCRFGPRCGYAEPVCRAAMPDLVAVDGDHRVRCTPRSRAAGAV
jgi:peptide/nickel transport system ATP-binding protein